MAKLEDERRLKMLELASEIRKEFTKIGEDLERKVIDDYSLVLSRDVDELRDSFNKALLAENQKFIKQAQAELQKLIKSKLEGNVFGDIFSDNVLPKIFGVFQGDLFGVGKLNQAKGQKFLEISKALSRYQSRNS